MGKVMVFVAAKDICPSDPHEWHVRGGVVKMGRPSIGFDHAAMCTQLDLFSKVADGTAKYKGLYDEQQLLGD